MLICRPLLSVDKGVSELHQSRRANLRANLGTFNFLFVCKFVRFRGLRASFHLSLSQI